MMSGFDLLGAVTPTRTPSRASGAAFSAAKSRAASAGQRAINAGKRIAKYAPRLSSAVVNAGQKAVAASKAKQVKATVRAASALAAPPTTALQRVASAMATTPTSAAVRAAAPMAPAPSVVRAATVAPVSVSAPAASTARSTSVSAVRASRAILGLLGLVGQDDTFVDDGSDYGTDDGAAVAQVQQTNAYADLADASANSANFVNTMGEYLSQLPPDSSLYTQGQNIVNHWGIVFGQPIENALSGGSVTDQTNGIVALLNDVLSQQQTDPDVGVWGWISKADAYLKSHGGAVAARTMMLSQAAPGVTPEAQAAFQQATAQAAAAAASTGGAVAKVAVTPAMIAVTPGIMQQFTVQALDSSGRPATAKSSPSWSISPTSGATIDQSGNFLAQTPGATFTVTATVDGVSGTASASVQSAPALPPSGGGGYGGGGGGGGDSGGGDYGDSGDASALDMDTGGDEGDQGDQGASLDEQQPEDAASVMAPPAEYQDSGDYADQGDQADSGDQGGDDMSSQVGSGFDYIGFAVGGGGGHGGGGHGGGGHGGHHGGGGFRRGGFGPGWWGGPGWWYGGDDLELLDTVPIEEEVDTDALAEAIARKLKKHKTTAIGEYNIRSAQAQMNTLKQVTVAMARAMAKHGLQVADETIALATGGMFQRELPGITSLKNTRGHVQWHADRLGSGDPTAIYPDSADLKKWIMQSWIDANSVAEGRERQSVLWDEMWTEIGEELAKLPAKVAREVAALPGKALEAVTGVPSWAWWVGGSLIVIMLGVGVWKLLMVAAPVATAVATRRYT